MRNSNQCWLEFYSVKGNILKCFFFFCFLFCFVLLLLSLLLFFFSTHLNALFMLNPNMAMTTIIVAKMLKLFLENSVFDCSPHRYLQSGRNMRSEGLAPQDLQVRSVL